MVNSLNSSFQSPDWVLGQQISVIAARLANYEPTKVANRRHLTFRNQMGQLLIEKLDCFRQEYRHSWSLPASALNLLEFLPKGSAFKMLPRWQKDKIKRWSNIYSDLNEVRPSKTHFRPSQLDGAKIIAHQILYSSSNTTSVIRSAEDFLANGFGRVIDDPEAVEKVRSCLALLRSPNLSNERYIRALEELTGLLVTFSPTALLVRNAVLDQLLSWPLMILGSSQSVGPSGVSLPVGVELARDGDCKVRCLMAENVAASDRFDFENWRPSLERAADVGKKMWRSKNGNAGKLRQTIAESSVHFDFSLADEIMAGIANWKLSASDRSLEAYLANAVLAKAGGQSAGSSAAITGQIGEQRIVNAQKPDPAVPLEDIPLPEDLEDDEHGVDDDLDAVITEETEVLDWRFEPASGLKAKGEFVVGSRKYDRYILPVLEPGQRQNLTNLGVEVNYCKYLSSVADSASVGGWRQFKYVRCNDVEQLLHINKSEMRPYKAGSVIKVLSQLQVSDQAVMNLDDDVDTLTLASALHHLNFFRRLAADAIPPSMSWSMLRRVEGEDDLRFWALLFEMLGLSKDDFAKFRAADGPTAAAKVLHSFYMGKGDQAGMPDLVVLLNHKSTGLELEEDAFSDHFRRHHIDLVLSEFNKLQVPGHRNEVISSFLGRTRLITLSSDNQVGAYFQDSEYISDLSHEELSAIARLRLFRFGFTQQMARVVLADLYVDSADLRSFLRALVRQKMLTYCGGTYLVRRLAESSANMLPTMGQARLMRTHFYAAMSISPFLSRNPIPGKDIGRSLLLHNVREATYHFERCAEHAANFLRGNRGDGVATGILTHARFAQQKLMRYFDTTTWGLITSLCKKRKGMPVLEAYELSKELLERSSQDQFSLQPHAFTTAALACQRMHEDQQKQDNSSDRYRVEAIHNFAEAERIARGHNRFSAELSFQVATKFSVFLHEHAKSEVDFKTRERLDREIEEHLVAGTRAEFIDVMWFGIMGDNSDDSAEALRYYQYGCSFAPSFFGNVVRMVGCLVELGRTEEATEFLELFDSAKVSKLFSFASVNQNKKFIDPKKRDFVIHRFMTGARFIQSYRVGLEDKPKIQLQTA